MPNTNLKFNNNLAAESGKPGVNPLLLGDSTLSPSSDLCVESPFFLRCLMPVIPTEGMVMAMWVIIGCGVWGIMMGATIVSCYMDDLEQEEYESLGNEQWQRDQDELEEIEN